MTAPLTPAALRVLDAALARWAREARNPVECSICEWRGRRIHARSRPCPQCGSKVDFR